MATRTLLPQAIGLLCCVFGRVTQSIAIESSASSSTLLSSYDYVIVGGGTAGLTVANRLSEDPHKTVLVVEYGYFDNSNSVLFPTRGDWPAADVYNITSAPQAGLNNSTIPVFVGSVVGGSSAINGMFFDRGSKNDYDEWEKLGNGPDWNWKGILPWFRKSVTFTQPSKKLQKDYGITHDVEAAYGGKGPIYSGYPDYQFPGQSIMWKAWDELPDIYAPKEGADGSAYGCFWIPNSLDPKSMTRSYARTGHYDPVQDRQNYHLLTAHKVTKINFSPRLKAQGVTVQARDGSKELIKITARKEVVLAAGAVHTPHVLQLSGIGPKKLLQRAGIKVLLDLPGVGMNVQDHAHASLYFNFTTDVFPNYMAMVTNTSFAAEALAQYEANRTGPYTFSLGNSGVFLPLQSFVSNHTRYAEELQKQDAAAYLPAGTPREVVQGFKEQKRILGEAYLSNKSAILEYPFSGVPFVSLVLLKPASRGSITLNVTDPQAEPAVDWRVLSNPIDLEIFIDMVKYVRRYFATATMAQLGPVEIFPGTSVASDEAIAAALRSQMLSPSNSHFVGSASMLPREKGGVVSRDLLVYGVEGLSVVDASIMPTLPGTHTSATVYAIAEKAADLIKNRA